MHTTTLPSTSLYHLRLGPGEDLFQALRDFLDEQRLSRAFVLSTIGSLRRAVVNFPMTDEACPQVGHITVEGLFEINGISGEVWRENGGVRVHLHGSITERAERVLGGGLGDGAKVLKLAEMVIAGIA